MVIITKSALHKFSELYPLSISSLNDWYRKAKDADWKNFNDVKHTFGSTDSIGNDRYVFNIGGNNYRLIAIIHFRIRTVYVRKIITHKEYDRYNKKGLTNTL